MKKEGLEILKLGPGIVEKDLDHFNVWIHRPPADVNDQDNFQSILEAPIKHDLYGMPTGPRKLFRMSFERDRFLYELPASTIRRWGQNIPFGGGGYLRHSPYWYTRRMVRRANAAGEPVVVYVHPWEIDPEPPVVEGLSWLQRFRTYGSTGTLLEKLSRLVTDFEFVAADDYIRSATRTRIGFERSE